MISQLRDKIAPVLPNLVALSGVQILNAVLPLVMYPYLLRVLGVEKMGIVFLAQALCQVFTQWVDYGFSNTAVKKIAQASRLPDLRKEIANAVLQARLVLLATGTVVYTAVVWVVPAFRAHYHIFLFSYVLVLGQALLPYWFFQGMEKMKFHALMNLISKIISLVLVFVFVREAEDTYLVNALLGLSTCTSALAGLIIMITSYEFRFSGVSYGRIRSELWEGAPYFASNLLMAIGNSAVIFLLGIFHGPLAAGLYGMAEKIMQALRAGVIVVYQALLPRMSALATISFSEVRRYFQSVFPLFSAVFIIVAVGVQIGAEDLIRLFSGDVFEQAVITLKIIIWAPLLSLWSVPFSQVFVVYDLRQSYFTACLAAMILGVIAAAFSIFSFGITGAAIGVLLIELTSLLSLALALRWRYPHYSLIQV